MSKPGSKVTATKRIKKEITDLAKENLGSISLTPDEANIFSWRAVLPGPSGSPYEGGMFEVAVRIPDDYPFSPPQLTFLTKVYHCNIASTGAICLDLLKNAWSPALSLYKVILSLSSLLTDPNAADPLVPNIAQEYRRNKKKHDETAREWTRLYALPKKAPPPAPAPVTRPEQTRMRSFLRPEIVSSSSGSASASASASPVPPPPVAGTRRTHAQANARSNGTGNGNGTGGSTMSHAIELSEDEGGSDVEVLGENGRGANGGGSGTAASTNGTIGGRRMAKRAKKTTTSTSGGGGASQGASSGSAMMVGDDDDVIVVD